MFHSLYKNFNDRITQVQYFMSSKYSYIVVLLICFGVKLICTHAGKYNVGDVTLSVFSKVVGSTPTMARHIFQTCPWCGCTLRVTSQTSYYRYLCTNLRSKFPSPSPSTSDCKYSNLPKAKAKISTPNNENNFSIFFTISTIPTIGFDHEIFLPVGSHSTQCF